MCAGVANGQPHYEAVELAKITRDMCTTDQCELEVRGNVGTVPSQDSTVAKVAVYNVQGRNGAMELVGESSITRASPHSDSWAVSFRFQDAQSLVLLHIRATTSKREVQLVPGKGKSTRKFLLRTPNQCHLCGSNASVLMDVEARITSLSVVTADSE